MGHLQTVKQFFKKYQRWSQIEKLFTCPSNTAFVGFVVIFLEFFINVWIIERVAYTEIDWKAYMQECEGFLNGTLDYSQLKGDTGPLVYPAGFVYIYSILYFITGYGQNVKVAQYIFLVIYLLQLILVFRVYHKTLKVPPYVLLITILTSYRIHSIYVLRLFNDPIAVLLFFASLNMFLGSYWVLGSIFFSLAVSIKMNILLFAPALLLFYLTNLGIINTVKHLSLCSVVQIVLGLPFICCNLLNYMKGSFDVGRVFNHTWTVNYRFLDVEVFENKMFHLTLLLLHLVLLGIFYPQAKQFMKTYAELKYVQGQIQPQIDSKNLEVINAKKKEKKQKSLSARQRKVKDETKNRDFSKDQVKFLNSFESSLKSSEQNEEVAKKEDMYSINFDQINRFLVFPMFLSNFIGIVCARSLHYQFYSWYFHTLPYLVWCTSYSNLTRFLILALIELSWNTYPSTIFSSALLHVCHVSILFSLYNNKIKTSS